MCIGSKPGNPQKRLRSDFTADRPCFLAPQWSGPSPWTHYFARSSWPMLLLCGCLWDGRETAYGLDFQKLTSMNPPASGLVFHRNPSLSNLRCYRGVCRCAPRNLARNSARNGCGGTLPDCAKQKKQWFAPSEIYRILEVVLCCLPRG